MHGCDFSDGCDPDDVVTERYVSPAVVARELDKSTETVLVWIRRKKVFAIRDPNGHYRIPYAVYQALKLAYTKPQKPQTDP